jgi:mannosyl-3-phosphoglycerate phosphatase
LSGPAYPLLFVTDLDGTLLDERDGSFEAARPALAALRERGIRLVLCSSKTRAEMEPLARALGLASPLVVENGGGLVLPDSRSLDLGAPRGELVTALAEIAAETGVGVRGFAAMSVSEVSRRTGLAEAAAALALDRHYDEPFLVEQESGLPRLQAAAAGRGLRITRGGCFHHLTGAHHKGTALQRLLGLLEPAGRRSTSVGLGDSPNDREMLEAVDRPILVPRPGGEVDASLRAALPRAERAPSPGPQGWNAAVLAVLEGRRPQTW